MDWLTNETVFYAGIAGAGLSVLLTVIYLCVSKIKTIKLKTQLDKEYGEKTKEQKNKRSK